LERKWGINIEWGWGKRGDCFGAKVHLRHVREDHVVVLWKGHLGIDTRVMIFS
jgi:hypothetical protein